MLPSRFTCAELIRGCGGNPEWAKDPRLTGAIARILLAEGYTQKMVHQKGQVERMWSRNWGGHEGKTMKKKVLDRRKLDVLERIRMVVR